MTNPSRWLPVLLAAPLFIILLEVASADGQRDAGGWRIPENAEAERNPVAPDQKVLDKGRELYRSKCSRCHGPSGRGDGSEADPERKPGDLTDASRAPRNPDGVLFYKIWNGRATPKMPAFSSELSREDVWAIVHYVKTLRQRE